MRHFSRLVYAGKPEAGTADIDDDGIVSAVTKVDSAAGWYLQQTTHAVQQRGKSGDDLHPKVSATVERAMALWARGEKGLDILPLHCNGARTSG